jgi:hypothetical protein
MKTPTFKEFKKDTEKSYMYMTIIALVSVFGLLMNKYSSEDAEKQKLLDDCNKVNSELHVKIEKLNDKIIEVVQKFNKSETL